MLTHSASNNSLSSRFRKFKNPLYFILNNIDPLLLILVSILAAMGLFVLFSATNQSTLLFEKQILRFMLGFGVMFIFASISPKRYYQLAPAVFSIALLLLAIVLVIGTVSKGAQRWLNLGLFHLQPSEIMKIALPMMLARYLSNKTLPPTLLTLVVCVILLGLPVLLTLKQPDLGTAIVIGMSGAAVLLLAGINWRFMLSAIALVVISAPILWHYMHSYQKERVLTFLNPERDPLGSGYHIIQSKIAIGSGGIFGKGWLQGRLIQLDFLPEKSTDFIFSVVGEELGFIGCSIIIVTFLLVFIRCLIISQQAQDTFSRLLAGSLSITFIASALINIGMVTGILPVVGVPLPLISYGGSSIVTIMASFGIIMSIHTHRKLWSS